jgi:hypothetical protein
VARLLTLTLWSVGIGDSMSRRLIHRPRGTPWSEPWYELVAKPCAAVGAVNLLQDDSVDNSMSSASWRWLRRILYPSLVSWAADAASSTMSSDRRAERSGPIVGTSHSMGHSGTNRPTHRQADPDASALLRRATSVAGVPFVIFTSNWT